MDNITNGLYIYHISIIGIFIVVWNICVFFFCIIHRYIHINWMIYNWVSTFRTCQGLEICKDPLGIKHGKLGNPPQKWRIPLEKNVNVLIFMIFMVLNSSKWSVQSIKLILHGRLTARKSCCMLRIRARSQARVIGACVGLSENEVHVQNGNVHGDIDL